MRLVQALEICFLSLSAVSPGNGQACLEFPAWLTPYPGSNSQTIASSPAIVEAIHKVSATPAAVLGHYQKLFEGAGLPWNPSFDGLGTSVRARAAECDLLIKVRDDGASATARVGCIAKSSTPLTGAEMGAGTSSPVSSGPSPSDIRRRMEERRAAHAQRAANVAAGRPAWPAGPENDAPPLVWPEWLTKPSGGRLGPTPGVDQSRKQFLQGKFVTQDPMSSIHTFYEALLEANGFSVYNTMLGTGQTNTGIVQNAEGHVEGALRIHGINGPRTVIRVSFLRTYLNAPIDVTIRVTVYPRF